MNLEKIENPEYSQYEYRWTNNRKTYNQLRKQKLENDREISCSWCPYNRGENANRKARFLGAELIDGEIQLDRNVSWKHSTNNRKQWMDKNFKFELYYHSSFDDSYYYKIIF